MKKNRYIYNSSLLKTISTILLLLITVPSLKAQRISVKATVQPSEILIGEQALINLQVIAPKDKEILFPIYQDSIVYGLEVLTMGDPDTTINNNVRTINMKYLVTSFDSTLYYVPFMPVSDGVDTVESNSFGLKVIAPELSDSTLAYLEKINTGQTDSIDFDELQLNDIKPIQKAPFKWTDLLSYIWIPLLVILLLTIIAFIVYLIIKKNKKGYFFTPPPILSPHVRAIRELDKIKSEKIWQQERNKEYYTQLTEVLRKYISERYGVNSLEMTTGEILSIIRTKSEDDSVYENLKQVLTIADLVKFAKHKPFMDENDLSLMNAYFFINQTKEEELDLDKATEQREEKVITAEEKD